MNYPLLCSILNLISLLFVRHGVMILLQIRFLVYLVMKRLHVGIEKILPRGLEEVCLFMPEAILLEMSQRFKGCRV